MQLYLISFLIDFFVNFSSNRGKLLTTTIYILYLEYSGVLFLWNINICDSRDAFMLNCPKSKSFRHFCVWKNGFYWICFGKVAQFKCFVKAYVLYCKRYEKQMNLFWKMKHNKHLPWPQFHAQQWAHEQFIYSFSFLWVFYAIFYYFIAFSVSFLSFIFRLDERKSRWKKWGRK